MKVALFGVGYVGAVTAACLAANGHEVCGVDVDPVKVAMIEEGLSPVVEPGLAELIGASRRAGRLRATTSAAEAMSRADVSILCVGTPSTPQGGTSLVYVHRAVEDLGLALRTADPSPSGVHAVVVRSTVPPGTVEEIGRRIGTAATSFGLHVGVAMCPEFLREGSGISDFYAPPFTVIGSSDPVVVDVVSRLFGFLNRPVHVVDTRTAEALKYACNAFHATKVSFTNELGRVFRHLGVDSRKVMDLFCQDDQLNISAKYLRPGFAFGGSCLPKDLRSLLHLARMESVDIPLLAGTLATNRLSITDVVERVVSGDGHTVAILGLSFKADSDDLRESPYIELAETLLGKGYDVRIYDPIVNPAALRGANREHVEARLPHLQRFLRRNPGEALSGADVAIVSLFSREVVDALVATSPGRIIDLDGRLGPDVEARSGYEGVAW